MISEHVDKLEQAILAGDRTSYTTIRNATSKDLRNYIGKEYKQFNAYQHFLNFSKLAWENRKDKKAVGELMQSIRTAFDKTQINPTIIGKKATVKEALNWLSWVGVDLYRDFHSLRSDEVNYIIKAGKAVGYRKPADASGSYGRYAFYYLQKKDQKQNPSESLKGAIDAEIEASKTAIERTEDQKDKTEEYISVLERLKENPSINLDVPSGWHSKKDYGLTYWYFIDNKQLLGVIEPISGKKYQAVYGVGNRGRAKIFNTLTSAKRFVERATMRNPKNKGRWYSGIYVNGDTYYSYMKNDKLMGSVIIPKHRSFVLASLGNTWEVAQQFGTLAEGKAYIEKGIPRTKRTNPRYGFKEYLITLTPKGESFNVPQRHMTVHALNKSDALMQAKAQLREFGQNEKQFKYDTLIVNSDTKTVKRKISNTSGIKDKVVWKGGITKYRPEGMRVLRRTLTDEVVKPYGGVGGTWYLVQVYSVGKWINLAEHRSKSKAITDAKNWYKSSNSETENLHKFDNTIDNLSEMFQGKISGKSVEVLASDLQPNQTARIGQLAEVIIDTPKGKAVINFDGESFVSMDRRKNLWLSGKDARLKRSQTTLPNGSKLNQLGYLQKLNYVTAKQHIENGEIIEFYHRLGEVDGETPTVYVDKDGFLIIVGGNYDVWDVGIVN